MIWCDDHYHKTEFLFEGNKIPYDACSTNELEKAKEFYKDVFSYIGSGYTYFINDRKYTSTELCHFFRRN
jgi:hypothetical protein